MGPLGLDRITCLTLVPLHMGIGIFFSRFGYPFSFSSPFPFQFYVGSSVRLLPPFVHGFPYSDDAFRIARQGILTFFFSMFIPGSLVFRVLSSTLLPADRWP